MIDSKTIEEWADEFAGKRYEKYVGHYISSSWFVTKEIFIAGAAKQKELDTEKIKDYEQALEFECGNRCAEQNPCNAKEVLKKWGRG